MRLIEKEKKKGNLVYGSIAVAIVVLTVLSILASCPNW